MWDVHSGQGTLMGRRTRVMQVRHEQGSGHFSERPNHGAAGGESIQQDFQGKGVPTGRGLFVEPSDHN